jgi:hypothetical protein
MSGVAGMQTGAGATALTHLRAALDELVDLPLAGLSRDELLDLCRGVEQQARRLPAFDHALVAQFDERCVAGDLAMRDTTTLLARLLHLSPPEARARTAAAAELGPRRGLTGEALPPLFPTVAAAQATGAISAAHARVITTGISGLPPDVEFTHGRALEATLVEQASRLDPAMLARAIRRITERLNPDGEQPDDREQQRRRGLHLRRNPDGSGELHGHLTPMATATWTTILDALSAPQPADGATPDGADGAADGADDADGADASVSGAGGAGEPDSRTPAQRRHDALLDAGQRLLRAGDLPDAGGAPVTIVIRMNESDLRTGSGYGETEHGELLRVSDLVHAAGDGAVLPVLLDPSGGIISYGRTRRLATAGQRRALAARDGGCSFPGCTTPASWCQTHHIRSWADGGDTSLDNLTLLCGYHHRHYALRGWDCTMIHRPAERDDPPDGGGMPGSCVPGGGVPHWRPPAWLDPDRNPRRNTAHHTELWFAEPDDDPVGP